MYNTYIYMTRGATVVVAAAAAAAAAVAAVVATATERVELGK